MNHKTQKFYCGTKDISYMGHSSLKHCQECWDEPAIPYELKDEEETQEQIKQYKIKWKKRYCQECGKLIPKYYKTKTGLSAKQSNKYAKAEFCDKDCRRIYTLKRNQRIMDEAPIKHCVICGDVIDKSRYNDVHIYLDIQTCHKAGCRAQIMSRSGQKAKEYHNKKYQSNVEAIFADVDSKYEI